MKPQNIDSSFGRIPIPKIFQPFLEDGLFEHCIVCHRFLLDDEITYVIEKAFKGTEVIVEYALCLDCCQAMRSDMSEESLMRISAHLEERVDFQKRQEQLIRTSPDNAEPWIAHCLFTGTPREQADTYHIFGHCNGKDLMLLFHPYMICSSAMQQLAGLLSKKTREFLDDFTDQYLGMPPEFKKMFEDSPFCLI